MIQRFAIANEVRSHRSRTIVDAAMRMLAHLVTIAVCTAATLAATEHHLVPGQLATLPALAPGDVVELAAGTYHEVRRLYCSGTREHPIVIRGAAGVRPLIDGTGCDSSGIASHPRGCLQVDGSWFVIEHLEFVNARNGDGNASGFRSASGGAAGEVALRDCVIHDCDMGVMADGAHHLFIEGCDIHGNGSERMRGSSHNVYVGCDAVTIRGSWIHDSTMGYDVKTRAHYVELLYNLITDAAEGEIDIVDSDRTTAADSNAVLIGNAVASKVRAGGANPSRFVFFGGEGPGHHGTLYAFNNTFVAATSAIEFFQTGYPDTAIVAVNNLLVGGGSVHRGAAPLRGAANWITAAGDAPAGIRAGSATPVFADVAGRDLRIAVDSPCRDQGIAPPPFRDGAGIEHASVPTAMYAPTCRLVPRGVDQRIDIGAYEVGGAIRKARPTQPQATPTRTAGVPAGDDEPRSR